MNYVMTKEGAKEPRYGSECAETADLEARGCGDESIGNNRFGVVDCYFGFCFMGHSADLSGGEGSKEKISESKVNR